jgi:hypothetical protein
MEEPTSDKERSSTNKSKESNPKTQGWIRIHQEENMRPYPADEQLEKEIPSHGRKIREGQEKP